MPSPLSRNENEVSVMDALFSRQSSTDTHDGDSLDTKPSSEHMDPVRSFMEFELTIQKCVEEASLPITTSKVGLEEVPPVHRKQVEPNYRGRPRSGVYPHRGR
eukprot:gnl/TRDRNA2_/TRDRNA2_173827_c0_seq9.p4 gnl/TRDRNA2_/TRDRNA2_173827_c0~~gnl/TRDRNA2_/TRDRNA2_173827_c0_seq9.p4  ORF type:complete len:103 (+),score=10.79 gnl/TRDRNA2_/TRDRNA2_173827_c0_seq9:2-310(+)